MKRFVYYFLQSERLFSILGEENGVLLPNKSAYLNKPRYILTALDIICSFVTIFAINREYFLHSQ